jgi:hypothetical protein
MLKKIVFTLAFSSLWLASFAQTLTKINNQVTPQHVAVQGSKLYMIPVEGFTQDMQVAGFVQVGTDNSILVKEAAGSFKSLTQTFMTENLTVKGMKLLGQEKFILNGDDAALFKLSQKVHKTTFTKFLFFFGDEDYCVLISSVFKENDTKLEEKIKKSLLSVAYKEESSVEPMPKGFRLDFKKSGLKYARSISDAVIYSAEGKTSKNALEQNSFFAGSGQAKTTDFAAFSTERIQKQIKTAVKIEDSKAVTIAGLPGQEITASTITTEGNARKLYQVLLFDQEKYYILFGSTIDNADTQMAVFQTLVKSFELSN